MIRFRPALLLALLAGVSAMCRGDEARLTQKAVADYLKDLQSKDGDTRRLAAEALGEHATEAPAAIPLLVKALGDEDAKVRAAAREALVELAPASASAVGKALKDKPTSVRLEAATALRAMGADGKAAVADLIAALKDEAEQVRIRAAAALGDMGPVARDAVPALIEATKDKSKGDKSISPFVPLNVMQAAIHAVLQIDPQAADELARVAVPLLIERLDEPAAAPGWPANSLAELGPRAKPAVDALKKRYRQEGDFVGRAAERALIAIGDDGWTAIAAVLADPALDSARRLAMLERLRYQPQPGSQLLPVLLRMIKDKDPRLRLAAVQVLGRFGPKGEKAIPALIATFADKELLRTPGAIAEGTKLETVAAVVRIGPAATPALIEALQDKDVLVRWQAASALAGLGRKARDALPALQRLQAREKQSGIVVLATAVAIIRLGGEEKPALQRILAGLESSEPGMRHFAVDCLVQLGPRAKLALPTLRIMLTSDDAMQRHQALHTLELLGPEAAPAVPALVDYLKRGGHDALPVLSNVGPRAKEAVPALVEVLDEQNRFTQQAVVEALAAIGPASKPAVPGLMAILKKPERTNGEPIKALGNIGPAAAEAVPTLLQLLDERNFFWRGEVAKALGQIGPAAKAAVPSLEKLLTDENKSARVWAAFALARIKSQDEPYVTLLRKAYKKKSGGQRMDFSRADAVAALALLGPQAKAALPELIAALDDDKTSVRLPVEAAQGLGSLGDAARAAVPRLMELLNPPEDGPWRKDYQKAAAAALGAMGPAAKAAVPRLRQLRDAGDVETALAAEAALAKIEKPPSGD